MSEKKLAAPMEERQDPTRAAVRVPSTSELQQTISDMADKIDALQHQMDAQSKSAVEGVPRMVDEMSRQCSRAEVDNFLNANLPKSTYYTFYPYSSYNLWPGGQHTDASQIKRRIPHLIMKFRKYYGVGLELGNPEHPSRKMPFGICEMHRTDIVGVTDEEVKQFGLDPNDPRDDTKSGYQLNGEPFYSLTKVQERILRQEELGTRKGFFTAEAFQMIIRHMYESKWAEVAQAQRLEESLIGIRPGREKTGNVDAPELLSV